MPKSNLATIAVIAICAMLFPIAMNAAIQDASSPSTGVQQQIADQPDPKLQQLVNDAQQADAAGDYARSSELWKGVADHLALQFGEKSWQVINARMESRTALAQSQFDEAQRELARQIAALEGDAGKAAESGDWNAVLEKMKEAAGLATQLFGEHSHVVARIHAQMGQIGHYQLSPDRVWDHYRNALTVLSEIMGTDHPEVEVLNYSLGNLLLLHAKPADAVPWLNEAMGICERIYGLQSVEYADRAGMLGTALYQSGNAPAALPLLQQAAGIQERILGANHPRYAQTLVDLGVVTLSREDYVEAARLLESASTILEKAAGPDQSLAVAAKTHLATALVLAGRSDEAEQQLRAVLATHQEPATANPSAEAAISCKLAILLGRKDQFEEADQLLRRAIGIQQEQLGKTHPETQRSLNALATLLDKAGRPTDAAQIRQHLQQIASQKDDAGPTLRR